MLEALDLLPLGVEVSAAHVAVGGELLELRLLELEVADDAAGAEIEVALDDLAKLVIGLDARAVRIDEHGQGLHNTDGVGDLDESALGEAGGNQGLGGPASGVGGGAIDLGIVLAGEGTTTVGAPAAISIDNDLATGQTGVAVGTADDETAGGVDVVDGVLIEVLGGDDGLDDVLHEVLLDLLVVNIGGMLSGDKDGVDALGGEGAILVLLVLGRDLNLTVGADPAEGAVLAHVGELLAEAGGELMSQGHERPKTKFWEFR